jgi:glycosyltransferase involved in cell wall biosynthesis
VTTRADPIASVVIAARNAADVIGVQLDSLTRQPEAADLEVVVVDNGSRDGTAAAAHAWRDRLPGLIVVDAPERAAESYARNIGVKAAQCDNILMCDADDRVGDGWAGRLLAALSSAGSAAGLVVAWDAPASHPLASRASLEARFGFLPAFGGNNAAFKKDAWAAVGGFDESMDPADDIDLSWRIQLAGHTLALVPDAIVYARPRSSARGAFRQAYHYGIAQVALFEKFAASGMPRSSWAVGTRRLASLLRHAPDLRRAHTRRVWMARAGWRVGRVRGSVTFRTLYL